MRLDLRLAWRNLTRRPGFSLLAILTLAVGVGVNAVAFSAVNGLLFHPFSFAGVDRLGWVMLGTRANPNGEFAWHEVRELQESTRAFDAVAAEGRLPVALRDGARSEQVFSLLVTRDYFGALGARAERGRLLEPRDADAVELAGVVSHRFWNTRLGGGPFTPRTLTVNDRTVSIVGVMPDEFQGPGGLYAPDIWLPFERMAALGLPPALSARDNRWLTVFARLAPGASPAQAQAELTSFAAHLQSGSTRPSTDGDALSARFYPMVEGHPEVRGIAPFAWIALSVVAIVLLIACFNVAALLLARAAERQREIGIRTALGATRWRVVRQLVLENMLLASCSGAAALVAARWSERLLSAFSLPAPIPQRLHMALDIRLLAFVAAAVVLAGVLPALLPALRATRHDLAHAMRVDRAPAGARPSRARNGFVVAQIAGSTVFLALAILVVRSFLAAAAFNPGFDLDRAVVATLEPAQYGYTTAESKAVVDGVLARLAGSPALQTTSAADRVPFYVGYPKSEIVSAPGESCTPQTCRPVTTYAVRPGYFAALGIHLIAGRDLTPAETDTGTAVIVSEAFAAAHWPATGEAVGQTLRVGAERRPVEIVGVARDVRFRSVSETPAPVLYRALSETDLEHGFAIAARASGDPRAAIVAIRDAIAAVAPRLPIAAVETMSARMALPLWPYRTAAGFFVTCGTLALALAMVGLFGVTYFTVRQRTREFGIRLAIGASAAQVMRQVIGEGTRLALVGSALGLVAAFVGARLLARALVGVGAADPFSFAAAAGIEAVVALAACALPAHRASQADPIIALRVDN